MEGCELIFDFYQMIGISLGIGKEAAHRFN